MSDISREKEQMKISVETSRLMADMMQHHERENKRLWCAVVALCVALMIMAGCMVWAVKNAQSLATQAITEAITKSQDAMNEAVLSALETVAEMEVISGTTTTTTTVTQDTGEGSGNNVYLDGDNTTYNEGSGAE